MVVYTLRVRETRVRFSALRPYEDLRGCTVVKKDRKRVSPTYIYPMKSIDSLPHAHQENEDEQAPSLTSERGEETTPTSTIQDAFMRAKEKIAPHVKYRDFVD